MDIKSLKAELTATQAKLSGIADNAKAANRDFTDAECTTIEQGAERAAELKAQIVFMEREEKSRALNGGKSFSEYIAASGDGYTDYKTGNVTKAEAKGYITPASIKTMVSAGTAQGIKSLVAGGTSATAVALDTNPIKLGGPTVGLSLLGLIPTKVRDTPKYSYLAQTVRTSNAAVVAAGGVKPTSVYTVGSVDGALQVVAHLSEYIDKYLLEDNSDLETFLDSELRDGIFTKVTELAVAGFAGTSGIQTQAFTTNIADSIFNGASKVQDLGYNPDILLINRADFDAMRLAKSTTGEYLAGNVFESNPSGAIWSQLTPVITNGVAVGTALVLDSSKVGLSIDKAGVQTAWDAATHFDKNELRARTEGRFGVDVFAAAAIVKVTVKAA